MRSLPSRSLLPLTHASFSASAYILMRETSSFLPWLRLLDDCIWALLGLAVLIAWRYLFPHKNLAIRGALIGGVVAVSMAALSLGLLEFGLPLWARTKPLGLPGGSLLLGLLHGAALIGWFAISLDLLVSAVVGGLVSGLLHLWGVQPLGKAGPALVLTVAGLAVIVPISAGATRATLGMGPIDLVRDKELQPFPVEISVDLTIDGAPITLRRVLSCSRLVSAPDMERVVHDRVARPYWLPTIKSFGQTFADGSGLFVITPDACRKLSSRWGLVSAWLRSPLDSPSENVLAPDFIPLIGWAADASALDAFDLYIDGTAYARPGSRIQVHKTTMRRMPFGTQLSDFDRFARIGWQDRTGEVDIPSLHAQYRAAFGIKISSEQLPQYPAVTALLASVTKPQFVLDAMAKPPDHDRLRSPLKGIHGDPFAAPFIARNGTAIPAAPTEGPAPERLRSLGGAVFPLRRSGDTWIASFEESGILEFHRRASPRSKDANIPSPITVGPYSVNREDGDSGGFLFDPTSMGLARLSVTYFTLAQPDGPFASR